MSEVIAKLGLQREKSYLYFISKEGDVCKIKAGRVKRGTHKTIELVRKLGIRKEKGFLYCLDTNGDVIRSVMAKGRKARPIIEKASMITTGLELPEL